MVIVVLILLIPAVLVAGYKIYDEDYSGAWRWFFGILVVGGILIFGAVLIGGWLLCSPRCPI